MPIEATIPGPSGRMEAKVTPYRAGKRSPVALILHHHASFGGGMDHQTLYQTHYFLSHRGFTVCRFNFRGVGGSTGTFTGTDEEVADANSVLDWLMGIYGAVPYLVVGFGFGAWVGAHLMARRPEVTDLVCAAPEPNLYDFTFMNEFCPASSLIVSAGADAVVPASATDDMVFGLRELQHGKSEHVCVPGANHNFDVGFAGLLEAIGEYLGRRFPGIGSAT